MPNIAIFASGGGSNAVNLINHFNGSSFASVKLLLCNKAEAPVVEKARARNVETAQIEKQAFYETGETLDFLNEKGIDFIILAGFVWLVPGYIISSYEGRVINLHPALLPNYGGEGMYGKHVHRAVLANKEEVSGITIHFANEHYDDGQRIFQAKCRVLPDEDTAETLAERIKGLEQNYFPVVAESVIRSIYSKGLTEENF